ncbi:hypothetical protein [Tautonia marina]|uniref:hypothetical protein n=1 Tax=Tautonia marina TaxID=2653855 RepID=UPI001261050A|nr:hypothetical protein [Tautonia marina]
MDNSSLVNVAGFLGFFLGIPAGIVAGCYRIRTRGLWGFIALCFALSIALDRTGLAPLFSSAFAATIWFALATEITRSIGRLFRRLGGRRSYDSGSGPVSSQQTPNPQHEANPWVAPSGRDP